MYISLTFIVYSSNRTETIPGPVTDASLPFVRQTFMLPGFVTEAFILDEVAPGPDDGGLHPALRSGAGGNGGGGGVWGTNIGDRDPQCP